MNPQDLLRDLEGNNKVRIVDNDRTIIKNATLYDISLSAHGEAEDEVFLSDKFLYDSIRRGNCLVQINKQSKNEQTYWARRGMKKFFDLYYEYILLNSSKDKDKSILKQIDTKSYNEHVQLYDVIFEPLRQAFSNGSQIVLYKTIKANGENAQVSYIDKLSCWAIGSKNVTLLAQSEEDLDLYTDDRFKFAVLIGRTWFDILSKIADVEQLKSDINGKTMVGEYCGNQEYQHLVYYPETTIIWFGITENEGTASCMSNKFSNDLFKKYNLKSVQCKQVGTYSNFEDMNKALTLCYRDVSSGSIEEQHEGSVFYFENLTTGQIVSMCKVKTLEYRIFRKLREKLRSYIQGGTAYKMKIISSFEKEVKQLCKHFSPYQSIESYFIVTQHAFAFAESYPNHCFRIHKQYITFLQVVILCINQVQTVQPYHFDTEKLLKLQEKSHHKEFFINAIELPPQTLFQDEIVQKLHQIYVIVPISIPGMGKSTFVKKLKELLDIEVKIVSSDLIRANLIKLDQKKNPKIKVEDLFKRTRQAADIEFEYQLVSTIQNSLKSVVIFLDKNHPPNAINKTLQVINKARIHVTSILEVDVKVIALLPKISPPLYIDLPFSPNFVFKCIHRIQERKDHETLSGNGFQSLSVMIMFIIMFRKFKFDHNGFENVVEIDFTEERNHVVVNPNLLGKLSNLIGKTPNSQPCNDRVSMMEFLHNFHVDDLFDEQYLTQQIQEQLIPLIDQKQVQQQASNNIQ